MAMLRHRNASESDAPARLLYSSRAWEDMIYREELERLAASDGLEVVHTLTRSQPPGWTGYARRVDVGMLREVVWPPEAGAARIRVRADVVRRDCGGCSRRGGICAGEHQDGALRSDGR